MPMYFALLSPMRLLKGSGSLTLNALGSAQRQQYIVRFGSLCIMSADRF
jgi:hypothetical protein